MNRAKISLYALIVAALIVLIFVVIHIAPISPLETAPVILPTATPSHENEGENNSGDSNAVQELTITKENVQLVIASMTRTENYHRVLTAQTFWENGSTTTQTEVWVSGGNARLISKAKQDSKNILIRDGELYIWYPDNSNVYKGVAGENDADEYQGIITYEEIENIDSSLITDAGYIDYNGIRCIYAEYTDELLGYRHRVYVCAQTGLVMGDETYDGEIMIYNLSSSEPDLTMLEESVFDLPKGAL